MYLWLPLFIILLTIELVCFVTSIGLSIHSLISREKSKFKAAILTLSIISFVCCFLSLVCFGLWRNTYLGFIFWVNFALVFIALILSIISATLPRDRSDENENVSNDTLKAKETVNSDYLHEIKELKKLLDCGALSQEEFEQRKKKILEDVLK